MYISQLKLQNYKNLDLELKLAPGINVIVAPNGSGKTNLLESIYYFASGDSFRSVPDEMIFPDHKPVDFSSAEIDLVDRSERHSLLKVVWNNSGKKGYFFDGRSTNLQKLKSTVKALLYAPTSLDLVTGGAKLRRDFLDTAAGLLRPHLRHNLQRYKRVILQKNRLLQSSLPANSEQFNLQLDYWNTKLVEFGAEIAAERCLLLQNILPIMEQIASQIYSMENYHPQFKPVSKFIGTELENQQELLENLQQNLRELLDRGRDKEIAAQAVLYGPQRDDFEFFLGDRSVRHAASRGQQRLFSLIIHLSVLQLLESEYEEEIIILLDDIFSELDAEHRRKTSDLLVNNFSNQIFLTAPAEDYLEGTSLEKAKRLKLSKR